MKRIAQIIVSAVLLSSGLAVAQAKPPAEKPAPAEKDKKGPNVGEKTGAVEASTIEATELATRLASWARSNQNPAGLIAAAQILELVKAVDAKREKTTEGGGESKKQAQPVATTAQVLRGEAQQLAKNNKKLADALDVVANAAPKSKGATRGPNRHCDTVRAGATDTFQLSFDGGRLAEIAVVGDGDTDLDLYVYDELGNLIEKDIDQTDRTYVRWFPRWTGLFTVRIKNLGSVYNEYCILTN